VRNGALLALAANAGFAALITMDASIPTQQNLATLPIAVVVLSAKSNRIVDLRPIVPRLLLALANLSPNTVTYVQ
jgi:hypothetical protein